MYYCREEKCSRAVIVLTPSESKKLIAKGVAALPEVQQALKSATIFISSGSTNSYIVEELTGKEVKTEHYTVGRILEGWLAVNPEETRLNGIALEKGKPREMIPGQLPEEFSADDVLLKGANAVDPEGNAAILAGHPAGGTIGSYWVRMFSQGGHVIVPVGLEKLVPSVIRACAETGQKKWDYHMGLPVALIPISGAGVFTEIQALEVLYDVEAVQIAAGGIMGSEGSVVLAVSGESDNIRRMWDDVNALKEIQKD